MTARNGAGCARIANGCSVRHVLAGPAFPGQEDDGVAAGDPRQDPRISRMAGCSPMMGTAPGRDAPRERGAIPEPEILDRPLDDDQETRPVDRFLEVVERTPLDRLDGGLDRPVRAVQDDRGPGRAGQDRVDQILPGHARHHEVGQDEVDLLAVQGLQGFLPGPRKNGPVPLARKDRPQDLALVPLVVDDEDGPLHRGAAPGRRMRMRVPLPDSESTTISPSCAFTIFRVRSSPSPSPEGLVV